MNHSLEQSALPLQAEQEIYEAGSLSFRTAISAIRSIDHSGLPKTNWENTPEHQILTIWLEGAKQRLPKLSLKAEIPKIIGAIGLVVDAASVGAAYAIRMNEVHIAAFCRQADAYIATHGGPTLLKLLDVTGSEAPQGVNTFVMSDSPTANAILAFASYFEVGNKLAFAAVAVGLPFAIDRAIRKKNIRIQEGAEKIRRREKVGTALIGPMSLMDAIAETSKTMKLRKSKDIIIHADAGIPSSLNDTTERHFEIPADKLSSFSRFIREQVDNWGLKKAKRLVLAAFDESFSLFYGPDATHGLTTSNMTTILAALAPEQARKELLKGKRTLLLAPDGASIVGASTTAESMLSAEHQPEYLKKLKESGMEVDIKTPESILYQRQLEKIIAKAKEKGNNEIVLVGSDGEVELKMLKRFRAFLINKDKNLTIHIITDTSIDGKTVEIGVRSDEAKNIIEKAGTIFVYADTDTKTTDATEGVLSHNVIPEENIPDVVHSIIESPDAFENDTGGLPANRICVFNEIAEFTKNWIDQK